MQAIYSFVNEQFFKWLNCGKNPQRMVYEIRHKFMNIAHDILVLEVIKEQQRLTPHGFVIGPFQEILENFAADSEPEDPDDLEVVMTYSQPLRLPQTSTLEDTLRQIREDEVRLAGVEAGVEASVGDVINDDPNFDPSPFFRD